MKKTMTDRMRHVWSTQPSWRPANIYIESHYLENLFKTDLVLICFFFFCLISLSGMWRFRIITGWSQMTLRQLDPEQLLFISECSAPVFLTVLTIYYLESVVKRSRSLSEVCGCGSRSVNVWFSLLIHWQKNLTPVEWWQWHTSEAFSYTEMRLTAMANKYEKNEE